MESTKTAAELKIVYRQLVKQVHVEDITQFKISNIKKIGKKFPGLENSKFSIQFIDDDNQKVEIKSDKDLVQAFVIASSRSFLRVMLVPIEKTLLEQVENDSDNGSDFELVDKSSSESEDSSDDDEDDDNNNNNSDEEEEQGKILVSSLPDVIPTTTSTNSDEKELGNDDIVVVEEEQDKDLIAAIAASFDEETKVQDQIDLTAPAVADTVSDDVQQLTETVESLKVEDVQHDAAATTTAVSSVDEMKEDVPPQVVVQVAEEAVKSAAPIEAHALHKALKAVIEEYSNNSSSTSSPEVSLPKLREALSLVLSNADIVAEIQQAVGTEQVKKFVVDVFTAEKQGKDVWAAASIHLVPILEIISKVMQNHPQLFALVPIVVVFLMDLMKDKPSESASASEASSSTAKRQRSQVVHKRVFCDGCKKKNPDHRDYISGIRYKSAMVEDFDLCESCEEEGLYNESHGPFLKIYNPSQAPESILCILKDDERNRNTKFGEFANDVIRTVPAATVENIFVDANGTDAENLLERVSSFHAAATAQVAASIPIASSSSISASTPLPFHFTPQGVAQSVQSATTKVLKCPSNHMLNRFEIPHFGFRCDVCGTRPNAGEIMFGCRTCDFDVCSSCADNIRGPEIKMMRFNCPGRHVLRRHLASNPLYTCDNCMFRPGLNGALYGCRVCNFDLCVNCYDEATRRKMNIVEPPISPAIPIVRPIFPACTVVRPQAKFVQDVTFKDGSIVTPGQTFVKIWRIKNPTKQAWPEGCRLAVVGGERFNAPLSGIPIRALAPEETAEISAVLVAPAKPGRSIGYFRLLTADSQRFGNRIWVDVTVDGSIGEAIAATLVQPLRNFSERIVSKVQEYQINNTASTPLATATVVAPQPSATVSSLSQINDTDIAFGQIVSNQSEEEKMRKYSLELQSLIDMGFADIEQNIVLLDKHNGNLEEVVAALFQQ